MVTNGLASDTLAIIMHHDLIIAGGGLAGTLTALRLLEQTPNATVLLLERGETLGGQHTWSFHGTDLSAAQMHFMQPFIVHSWPMQSVRFRDFARDISASYHTIRSERFHQVAHARLGTRARLGADVQAMDATSVTLESGEHLTANVVIDATGPQSAEHWNLAYQAFVGQEVELERPHGLTGPIIMDATVNQHDGYRFVYVLPYEATRVLVEDTYYVDQPRIEPEAVRERLADYVRTKGWGIARVIGEEQGILPLMLAGDANAFWSEHSTGAVPMGLRAGLFHPVTGYSLPDAVRSADCVADCVADCGASLAQSLDADRVRAAMRQFALQHWRDGAFYRMLNRMLFLSADVHSRHRVLSRFYQLNEDLVQRFYAGRSTVSDKLRTLCGKPPIPIIDALRALPNSAASRRGGVMVQ